MVSKLAMQLVGSARKMGRNCAASHLRWSWAALLASILRCCISASLLSIVIADSVASACNVVCASLSCSSAVVVTFRCSCVAATSLLAEDACATANSLSCFRASTCSYRWSIWLCSMSPRRIVDSSSSGPSSSRFVTLSTGPLLLLLEGMGLGAVQESRVS